jgi:2-polyprenyl-6-methoxyphenol hydroxylase-like FAD-dependent oxidoreductase
MADPGREPLRVLIIGAGTGGLALAHALKGAGIAFSVFERHRNQFEDQGGYRVGISPAGSRALKSCVPPCVFDLFVGTCARAPRYFNLLTEKFSEVLCLELQKEAEDPVAAERNIVRTTLRRVLMTGLEGAVFSGKEFTGYPSNADGSVTAHFADGSTDTGTLLVGADGTASRVRKQRLPDARLEETGIVSLGGKLPMTARTQALLSDRMLHGMSMIMAPRGFGAIIHSLDFSDRRRNREMLSRWPQFSDAVSDDSLGWGLWGAHYNFPQDPASLTGEAAINLALAVTRTWDPRFRTLIAETDRSTVQHITIRTSVPPPPWQSSNVTLLGDAIHTMTPGRGAGANTALRDAALLRDRLVEVRSSNKPLLQAVHEYEVEMLRYSGEAVRESRKQMSSRDMIHKPVMGRLQLATMRVLARGVNALPFVKRRIIRNIMRIRGAN